MSPRVHACVGGGAALQFPPRLDRHSPRRNGCPRRPRYASRFLFSAALDPRHGISASWLTNFPRLIARGLTPRRAAEADGWPT